MQVVGSNCTHLDGQTRPAPLATGVQPAALLLEAVGKKRMLIDLHVDRHGRVDHIPALRIDAVDDHQVQVVLSGRQAVGIEVELDVAVPGSPRLRYPHGRILQRNGIAQFNPLPAVTGRAADDDQTVIGPDLANLRPRRVVVDAEFDLGEIAEVVLLDKITQLLRSRRHTRAPPAGPGRYRYARS